MIEQDDISTIWGHGSIDAILARRANKEDLDALKKAEYEKFRIATNEIFNSDNGRYWLSRLMRYCHINTFDKELNPAKLVEDRGKQMVFLEFILPHLDKEIRKELEL